MQADLSLRSVRYGICSCKATELNNRQCLFFFALFGYDIGSRHLSMSNFFSKSRQT